MEPSALVDACTEILRGERRPEPRFAALIAAFAEEYGIEVVNVTSDSTVVRGCRGRLQLWCRTAADHAAFRDGTGNYDRAKQARASELVAEGPWFAYSTDYSRELLMRFIDIGVRAVGPTARVLLGDERIVRVDGAFGHLVVFVGTKAEAAALRRTAPVDPLVRTWEDRLWEAFAEHASPDFVPREHFSLEIDSQEAYDVDYRGSGYNYWR